MQSRTAGLSEKKLHEMNYRTVKDEEWARHRQQVEEKQRQGAEPRWGPREDPYRDVWDPPTQSTSRETVEGRASASVRRPKEVRGYKGNFKPGYQGSRDFVLRYEKPRR